MNYKKLAFISLATITLAGCSGMGVLKEPLADGTQLTGAPNLEPTAAWGCQQVKRSRGYDWNIIRKEANQMSMTPKTDTQIFIAQLAEEANAEKIKANYVNMLTPETKSISVGGFTHTKAIRTPVYAIFYQCEKINPEGKMAFEKTSTTSFG